MLLCVYHRTCIGASNLVPTSSVPSQAPESLVTAPSGRRRALLIGINYQGTSNQLGGCINDTMFMKFCLMKNFGYTENDFTMLNEDVGRNRRDLLPTRANMLRHMRELVTNCRPGDRLFFHYSGHGAQEPCQMHDEEVRYDVVHVSCINASVLTNA